MYGKRHRKKFTIIRVGGEQQWSVFRHGKCVFAAYNPEEAEQYVKEQLLVDRLLGPEDV